MYNILLSTNDFDNEDNYEMLKDIIKPYMRVTILPFSYDFNWLTKETFNSVFNRGYGTHYKELIKPFLSYGIDEKNIYIADIYNKGEIYVKNKISRSDILFFTGGDPNNIMEMLNKYNLLNTVKDYKNIVMGFSAGAMVQCKEYLWYNEQTIDDFKLVKGLGFIKENFDILVHYKENEKFNKIIKINQLLRGNTIEFYKLEDSNIIIFEDGYKIKSRGD